MYISTYLGSLVFLYIYILLGWIIGDLNNSGSHSYGSTLIICLLSAVCHWLLVVVILVH